MLVLAAKYGTHVLHVVASLFSGAFDATSDRHTIKPNGKRPSRKENQKSSRFCL
jgi:hypothetical protein